MGFCLDLIFCMVPPPQYDCYPDICNTGANATIVQIFDERGKGYNPCETSPLFIVGCTICATMPYPRKIERVCNIYLVSPLVALYGYQNVIRHEWGHAMGWPASHAY